jgi:hypothetical protein
MGLAVSIIAHVNAFRRQMCCASQKKRAKIDVRAEAR